MSKREEFSKRLKELLEKNNMSQRDLARKIYVTDASMSLYLSGNRWPKYDLIEKMANIFDVPVSYILNCEEKKLDMISENGVIQVPVLKKFKFGDPLNKDNTNIIRYIPVAAERFINRNTLFFKEVQTDEMNPLLFKGDLVLFEVMKSGIDKIHIGDICLCTKGNEEAVIREMVTTTNGFVFNLMNVNMPPRPRTLAEIKEEDINIVAKALEVVHVFPDRSKNND